MSIVINLDDPHPDLNSDYAFMAKDSGVCMAYGNVGGGCMLEKNDNPMDATSTVRDDLYDMTTTPPYAPATTTNREIAYYLADRTIFDDFDGLWASSSAVLSSGDKDGRIYKAHVESGIVD